MSLTAGYWKEVVLSEAKDLFSSRDEQVLRYAQDDRDLAQDDTTTSHTMLRNSFSVVPRLAVFALATLCAHATLGAQKAPAKTTAKRAAVKPAAATAPVDGSKMFSTTCAACHQLTGEGLEEKYPPLVGSEWVVGSDARLVRIILQGLMGPVDVAGQAFDGAMPAWGGVLKDPEIAAVATYVRGAWGNKAAPITAATVAAIRNATSSRKTPWTAAEIAQIPALAK